MDLEPEDVWLRHRLRRLRAILRLVNAPGRRSAAKLPTKDEARRIATNVAKLLETALKKAFPFYRCF